MPTIAVTGGYEVHVVCAVIDGQVQRQHRVFPVRGTPHEGVGVRAGQRDTRVLIPVESPTSYSSCVAVGDLRGLRGRNRHADALRAPVVPHGRHRVFAVVEKRAAVDIRGGNGTPDLRGVAIDIVTHHIGGDPLQTSLDGKIELQIHGIPAKVAGSIVIAAADTADAPFVRNITPRRHGNHIAGVPCGIDYKTEPQLLGSIHQHGRVQRHRVPRTSHQTGGRNLLVHNLRAGMTPIKVVTALIDNQPEGGALGRRNERDGLQQVMVIRRHVIHIETLHHADGHVLPKTEVATCDGGIPREGDCIRTAAIADRHRPRQLHLGSRMRAREILRREAELFESGAVAEQRVLNRPRGQNDIGVLSARC